MIVKPSSLGDIVHTLPAVQAIKEAHPQLKLRWLANTEWTPLLQGSPLLEEVISFPRKQCRGLPGLFILRRWAKSWRAMPREAPEIVLDFQGLFRSGYLSRARGSRPVIGLSDSREGARFFHDHILPVDAGAHAVDRYLAIPRALGIPVDAEKLTFPLAQGHQPAGWPDRQDLIVVHPWSRGEGKSLSPEALQSLCTALAPLPVVLVGMSQGAAIPQGEHITDFSNRTSLAELIWILRQARFVISVDSGPMHIAAAVNDRTLGIHTWSDPRQVGPYNPRAWVWKAGRIAHRTGFQPQEYGMEKQVTEADAGDIAAFVRNFRD
ncbi:heptosyltransferase-1/heptosyltransferase-2 [Prosthecobacter fusiformis]|uniref:Heptosyltransferase-1/heptosyltransferase-2 n=1 Tax=Prosthecobacter fusiformis TaxID=48464 RepID=A0A4V3FFH9_9BACT|nr:glycosyltransferase family 9 protein [Prosthecobacter fusiformis]TDU70843.1 heptosyltransferase-1/heptosyltransferase-2 [Prosthecobacter fusiformis]